MSQKAVFYGVRVGRKLGVFTSWDECQKSVDGYSGAEFKKFKTESEAAEFVSCYTPPKNENTKEGTTTNQNESHEKSNQSNASSSKSQRPNMVQVTVKAPKTADSTDLWLWEVVILHFNDTYEMCKIYGFERAKNRAKLRAITRALEINIDKETRLHYNVVIEGKILEQWQKVFMIEQVGNANDVKEIEEMVEKCKEEMGKFTHLPSLGKQEPVPDVYEMLKNLYF